MMWRRYINFKKCILYSGKLLDQLFDKININVLEKIYKFIVINSLKFIRRLSIND